MTSHTPGPWHTSPTHQGQAYDIGATNNDNVALVPGPSENGSDNFQANARLIAAAPDLLAALEGLMEIAHRIEGCPDPDCLVCASNKKVLDTARAALDRARPNTCV